VVIEAELRRYFAAHGEGLVAAYLFGSVARGTARDTSDVDVGVLFERKPPSTLDSPIFRLEADLERLLKRRVQVVALNTASAMLVHRVLRDGKVLLDANRSARIRFEVARQNEYFDLQPILRRCARLESSRP
jgi:predicted nucleotidyltransferase